MIQKLQHGWIAVVQHSCAAAMERLLGRPCFWHSEFISATIVFFVLFFCCPMMFGDTKQRAKTALTHTHTRTHTHTFFETGLGVHCGRGCSVCFAIKVVCVCLDLKVFAFGCRSTCLGFICITRTIPKPAPIHLCASRAVAHAAGHLVTDVPTFLC